MYLKKKPIALVAGPLCVIIDKGLISVVHFLVGLLVLRATSKDEYGIYVNLFSLLMLGVGFQNALVTTPMAILAPRKTPREATFLKQAFWGQWIYWVPLLLVLLMTIGFIQTRISPLHTTVSTQVAVLLTLAMFFIHEFGRNYWFIRNKSAATLRQDILYGSILGIGMLLLVFLQPVNMARNAFLAMALAAGVSGTLTIVALHAKAASDHTPTSFHTIAHTTSEMFVDGKWAFGGVIITWLQNTSYAWLLTLLAGPAETADVNAARQLLMPIALLTAAYPSFFRPRWARFHYMGERHRIDRESRLTLVLILVSITLASIAIRVAHVSIIPILFGHRYMNAIRYLPLIAIIMGLTVWATNSSIKLQVMSQFRQITQYNAITCILTIGSACMLVRTHAAYGSLAALIVGQGAFAILLWLQLRRHATCKS